LKVRRSRRSVYLAALIWVTPIIVACGGRQESASADSALERVAWLGSVEGWGLLGLPLGGGPLTYLSASNLESPTWAPPELGRLVQAWPGDDVIWTQYADTRVGLYDYSTGHLLSFDSLKGEVTLAVSLGSGADALAVAPDSNTIEVVGMTAMRWRFDLGGALVGLKGAGQGRLAAVVSSDAQNELMVLAPPSDEPLARRTVPRVSDLVVAPAGAALFYTSADATDFAVHGLGLPELDEIETYTLPEKPQALAVTPSGHRLYVAAGSDLHVFDLLRGERERQLALPGRAVDLRFSVNGACLLARLDANDEIAVLRVGVDSVLGVLTGQWDGNLPVSPPGGRVIIRADTSLVLYDVLRLVEVARADAGDGIVWLAVNWQPPRPRTELASRSTRASEPVARAAAPATGSAAEVEGENGTPAGFYAVVLAARQRSGVDELVTWLRSVGYGAVVDLHEDMMGIEWFRAMVGPYPSREQAEAASQSLAARYGYKPWILRVEPEAQTDEPAAEPGDEPAIDIGDLGEIGTP
jgi:hypothetical protein